MRRPLSFAAALLLLACMLSQPLHADDADLRHAIREVLTDFRQEYGFPGATVAVALQDGPIATAAVGWADVEAGIAMTSRSRMLAASIGKTIWGALVLSLEADGALRRTDLVATHLAGEPWFARLPNAETMTVGQLLTHSAGLPDHVHMPGFAAELIERGPQDPPHPVEAIALVLDAPALFEAGTAWAYSDTGYLLLGLVIEAATGEDVYNLARERFLEPLGLTGTGPSRTTGIAGLAVGYTSGANAFGLDARTMDDHGALTWNPAVEWTGGGFASTSVDLATWGRALFTGTAMERPYLDRLLDGIPVDPDMPGIVYGSGVAIYRDTQFGPVYGHGGWIPGYVSSLRHYRDHGLTIAFQINSDVGVADDMTDLVPALERALAEALIGAASN